SSCCSSVSILPNRTSGCSSLAAWKTGANWRHGPHHSAHQSTRVMPSWVTVFSKVSFVSSIVLMPLYNAAGPAKFRPGEGLVNPARYGSCERSTREPREIHPSRKGGIEGEAQ